MAIAALLQLAPKISSQLAVNWKAGYWNCLDRSSVWKPLPPRVRISGGPMCLNVFGDRMSLWPLLPRRYIYSSDIADVDPFQVSELWAKTLKVRRDPEKIMKSLKHSFVFVVVLTREEEAEGTQTKIVGIGRAISDGAFIATICDVAVDPAHQTRGIGRKIVKHLVKVMKKMDGPSGFAVFPPPLARRFFWMIGFRSDKKFYFMVYRGKLLDDYLTVDVSSVDREAKVKLCLASLQMVFSILCFNFAGVKIV